jgi:UDP-glucose 4-epimerase
LNGTITALESIDVVNSIKRFIYASSSFVYGNFNYDPADENHPTMPIDLYGGTKLSGEILTKIYGKKLGREYVIIRPSAVYGPTDCNRRVSQIFIECALNKKPLILENGGEGKVDFTYVEDTAHGFVLACFSPKAKNETFNITRGEGRSIKEYAQILKKMVPGLKTQSTKSKVVRPNRGALDISKAKKLIGYQPKYPLEKGLKKYFEFVKSAGVV